MLPCTAMLISAVPSHAKFRTLPSRTDVTGTDAKDRTHNRFITPIGPHQRPDIISSGTVRRHTDGDFHSPCTSAAPGRQLTARATVSQRLHRRSTRHPSSCCPGTPPVRTRVESARASRTSGPGSSRSGSRPRANQARGGRPAYRLPACDPAAPAQVPRARKRGNRRGRNQGHIARAPRMSATPCS